MSKKPTKGAKSTTQTPSTAPVPSPEKVGESLSIATTETIGDSSERNAAMWQLARRSFPWAGVALAIVIGFTHGVPTAVLVLAGTALLTGVSAIWASLQVLAGDRPDNLDGALQLATAGGESEQKAFLLRALKDLELERSLGKISDQDYEDLKQQYRARAKEVLQELDRRTEPARAEAEAMANEWLRARGLEPASAEAKAPARKTEEERVKAKAPLVTAGDEKPREQDASHGAVERRTCTACEADNEPDARFCKKCGKAMDQQPASEAAMDSEES